MKTFRLWLSPAVAVVALGAALSCSDSSSPTGPLPTPPAVATGGGAERAILGVTFLSCSAMTADSVSQAVGTSGGTINVGPHVLVIPEDALDSTVTITAIAPSDTFNRVQLFPEGLTFNKQATLTMSYANCPTILSLVPKRIAYVSADLSEVLALLSSLDLWWNKKVRGKLDHFSDYVIAW